MHVFSSLLGALSLASPASNFNATTEQVTNDLSKEVPRLPTAPNLRQWGVNARRDVSKIEDANFFHLWGSDHEEQEQERQCGAFKISEILERTRSEYPKFTKDKVKEYAYTCIISSEEKQCSYNKPSDELNQLFKKFADGRGFTCGEWETVLHELASTISNPLSYPSTMLKRGGIDNYQFSDGNWQDNYENGDWELNKQIDDNNCPMTDLMKLVPEVLSAYPKWGGDLPEDEKKMRCNFVKPVNQRPNECYFKDPENYDEVKALFHDRYYNPHGLKCDQWRSFITALVKAEGNPQRQG